MITVQIVSDLHIEYNNNNYYDPLNFITPSADILILAGDIGSLYKHFQLKDFLIKICKHFQIVLYVPGNHEYYITQNIQPVSMDQLISRLYDIKAEINNLYILDRASIQIGNVCIAGCTLWSDINIPIPKYLVRIYKMNTNIYKKKFNKDLNYINNIIKYCSNNSLKLLIVTHYVPTYKILKNTNKKEKFFSLYGSNLDNLLTFSNIHTWVCGHVHKNFDFVTEGGTRLVSNQKGKPKDKINNFLTNFTIQI
jgi:Icc-related predicted phosphoesterase